MKPNLQPKFTNLQLQHGNSITCMPLCKSNLGYQHRTLECKFCTELQDGLIGFLWAAKSHPVCHFLLGFDGQYFKHHNYSVSFKCFHCICSKHHNYSVSFKCFHCICSKHHNYSVSFKCFHCICSKHTIILCHLNVFTASALSTQLFCVI